MPNIIVIGENDIDLLKKLISNTETSETQTDVDADAYPFVDEPYTIIDLVEDEDLRLIVQTRLEDDTKLSPGYALEVWADTLINHLDLEYYRNEFPHSEYRLVAVYDEIVTEFDSVDQDLDPISQEDEIGLLKAEILKLKAVIANYETGDNAQ